MPARVRLFWIKVREVFLQVLFFPGESMWQMFDVLRLVFLNMRVKRIQNFADQAADLVHNIAWLLHFIHLEKPTIHRWHTVLICLNALSPQPKQPHTVLVSSRLYDVYNYPKGLNGSTKVLELKKPTTTNNKNHNNKYFKCFLDARLPVFFC